MRLGYARVSTAEQNLDLQHDALDAAGAERTFDDHGVSGTIDPQQRDGFAALLAHAREGDEIIVWRLDRVGRSAAAVLRLVELLDDRGITMRSLTEGISTAGSTGRLVLTILAAVAEMERSVIAERTTAGIAAARARGQRIGRPPALNPDQRQLVTDLRGAGRTLGEIVQIVGVSKSTVRRALADRR